MADRNKPQVPGLIKGLGVTLSTMAQTIKPKKFGGGAATVQYPHEKEVLFNPLTGLEVKSTRVEGSVLVISVAPSINLNALTIDQVLQ